MKTLLFVPYDDPQVVEFFRAGLLAESPLIFLSWEISEKIMSDEISSIAMDFRGLSSLEEYVAQAVQIAKESAYHEECVVTVCLLPYLEFIEVIATEVSLSVPFADFFTQHVYESYDSGEVGDLYELRRVDDERSALHKLSDGELNLLLIAN